MPYACDRMAYIESEENKMLKRQLDRNYETFKKIALAIEDGKYQAAHGLCLQQAKESK